MPFGNAAGEDITPACRIVNRRMGLFVRWSHRALTYHHWLLSFDLSPAATSRYLWRLLPETTSWLEAEEELSRQPPPQPPLRYHFSIGRHIETIHHDHLLLNSASPLPSLNITALATSRSTRPPTLVLPPRLDDHNSTITTIKVPAATPLTSHSQPPGYVSAMGWPTMFQEPCRTPADRTINRSGSLVQTELPAS